MENETKRLIEFNEEFKLKKPIPLTIAGVANPDVVIIKEPRGRIMVAIDDYIVEQQRLSERYSAISDKKIAQMAMKECIIFNDKTIFKHDTDFSEFLDFVDFIDLHNFFSEYILRELANLNKFIKIELGDLEVAARGPLFSTLRALPIDMRDRFANEVFGMQTMPENLKQELEAKEESQKKKMTETSHASGT